MSESKTLKPGWKVWRFDQMTTNVNARIDNPSESGMEYYVGLEHLDADSLCAVAGPRGDHRPAACREEVIVDPGDDADTQEGDGDL